MAFFGWGVGFYGPSIFLQAVLERTGWSLALVSTAVTVHYLVGAVVVARLPVLHRRFGVGLTAVGGALCTALGVLGWAVANAPWQLFAAALFSGAGWVTMGAVAVNAAIAPWYERDRPLALAKAYNGASIGGVVFMPLWVLLITQWGFAYAAAVVGGVMIAVMVGLERGVFVKTPAGLAQRADNDATGPMRAGTPSTNQTALPGGLLWRDRQFVTLALGMAAGLFAQVGMLAHLFILLAPALGTQAAGLAMGFATLCAMGGRLVVAGVLPAGSQRRTVAALAYGVQLVGSVLLLLADAQQIGWILLGIALYGSGIGNATSLPPLIAQVEFAKQDVPRVIALIVAMGQATYAFAPAVFGLLLSATTVPMPQIGSGTSLFFAAVVAVQGFALACFLAGRRRG